MGPAPKRRKLNSAVPELLFDDSARTDYLTGFHKRKQARIKHAQEIAAKKERQEKLRERAALRKQRQEQLEAHVAAVNQAVRRANGLDSEDEEAEGDDGEEEWGGFESPPPLNKEDEYIDEEKYTTVTIETVDVTKDGLARPSDDESEDDAESNPQKSKLNDRQMQSLAKKDSNEKVKPSRPKKRKKKFRYEDKDERKVGRARERSKNSQQAQKRRSNK